MTTGSPSGARRPRLRPLLVIAGLAVALAGIGGTTGLVIGSAVSPPTGYHHHERHGRFDQGRPVLPPGPVPGAPAAPAPAPGTF
jgi:hypothetical protein